MTLDHAIGANRRNARASTGPRTMAGKTRAAQNARKHGLAVTQGAPDANPDVERLAAVIVRDRGADPALWDAARVVAET